MNSALGLYTTVKQPLMSQTRCKKIRPQPILMDKIEEEYPLYLQNWGKGKKIN